MVNISGTANDYQDFWDTLLDFLQNNVDLVAAGENWSVAWQAPVGAPNESDIVLQGPGLSGTDEVLIGLRLAADVPGDQFSVQFCGMTGVLAEAEEFDQHVNCTPAAPLMFLDSNPMPYWINASGRRFVAVARCSTVYEAMYAGLFLPYSAPSGYPYPLLVGGCSEKDSPADDWRSTDDSHTMFQQPYYMPSARESAVWVLSPVGDWLRCSNDGNVTPPISLGPDYFGVSDFDISADGSATAYGYRIIKDKFTACYGSEHILTPITIVQSTPSNQTYGVLDGVYHVPGHGNVSENLVAKDGTNHLVVQNTFRTDIGGYIAVALED